MGAGAVVRLHREEWLRSAGRPVRALVAGEVVPGMPRIRIVPGLGAMGYMLDLLHACAGFTAPSRVAGLVLVRITFDPPVRERRARLVPRLRTYLYERPRQLALTVPDFVRGGPRLARYIGSALRDRPEDHVPRVTCPVLLLRGEHDTLSPVPWVHRLAGACADGRALTLPGSHNVTYTHPGAVALQLGAFARRITQG